MSSPDRERQDHRCLGGCLTHDRAWWEGNLCSLPRTQTSCIGRNQNAATIGSSLMMIGRGVTGESGDLGPAATARLFPQRDGARPSDACFRQGKGRAGDRLNRQLTNIHTRQGPLWRPSVHLVQIPRPTAFATDSSPSSRSWYLMSGG